MLAPFRNMDMRLRRDRLLIMVCNACIKNQIKIFEKQQYLVKIHASCPSLRFNKGGIRVDTCYPEIGCLEFSDITK